jgi:phosphohistidine swiveling domain-containing protein
MDQKKIKNEEVHKLAEQLKSISYYPRLVKEVVSPLAKKHLEQLGVKEVEKSLEVITLPELLAGRTEQIPARLEARKQGKHFVYEIINGKESIHWRDDVKDIIKELEPGIEMEATELKGQVAFPGKVKGVARLILTADGRGVDFKEGEIIVTISTNPDLIQIMKKCSAIVTDEGGITSHAAIISRELKKPCIVGTKTATSILKDKDLVEVDAEKGVVKKIR